jgi:FkbH-like protein
MNAADFLFPRDLELNRKFPSKILLIGSCLSEFYVLEFKKINPDVQVDHILFNNAQALPLKSRNELATYGLQYIQLPLRSVLSDAVVRMPQAGVNVDWLEIGKSNIDAMLNAALAYCNVTPLLSIIANFVVPQSKIAPSLADGDTEQDMVYIVRELNSYLASAIKRYQNAYLADIEIIASSMGKKYFLDDSVYFFTHGVATGLDHFIQSEAQFSLPAPSRLEGSIGYVQQYESKVNEYFLCIFRQIEVIYRIVNQVDSIKLVIFDLDNTLWRGLIAEHYEPGTEWPTLHGWPTGVWDAINQLRRRGIVVSLASKNDEQIVIERWRHAISIPWVEYQDFLVPKINWLPKAQNIAAIMEELSLTPKNVLFVDDNPVERDSVKAAFPEIRVIGADPFSIKRILLWSPETQMARISVESALREQSLINKVKRDQQRVALPRSEFLRSLDSEIEIIEVSSLNSPAFYRIFELVNKTNQFNTVGIRRGVEDYQNHWREGGRVFAFSVKDRYSEYGLVGVILVINNCITQYVMSCRVLGMEIEFAAIYAVVQRLREADLATKLTAVVQPTEKNMPARTVFLDAGFDVTDNPHVFQSTGPLPIKAGTHVRIRWSSQAEPAPAPEVVSVQYHTDKKFEDRTLQAVSSRLRIAFVGNGLTQHEPSPEIGWLGMHGMAASSSATDYVHLTLAQLGIQERDAYVRNFYSFETDRSMADSYMCSLQSVFDQRPLVFVIQLGDSVADQEQLNSFAYNMKLLVSEAVKHTGRVYCISSWWHSEAKDFVIETVSKMYGATYVFVGDLYNHPNNPDRRNSLHWHKGVEAHPQDWGMEQIADRLVSAIGASVFE